MDISIQLLPGAKATLLRDPVERTVSHYLHYIRDPSLPYHAAIKNKSLQQVCKDAHLSSFIKNYQTRYLSTLVTDPVQFEHTIELRYQIFNENDIFDAAVNAIKEFQLIGLQEKFEDFLTELADAWNLASPVLRYRQNIATNREHAKLDADIRKLIFSLTEMDYEIYNLVGKKAVEQGSGR